MIVPKKLVEYNFSYPKRKIKKPAQYKKEENIILQKEPIQSNMPEYNRNIEINQPEDEEFWVDCQKY
jgi:hypothetical protein